MAKKKKKEQAHFPFLLGGTFIEAYISYMGFSPEWGFPFLLGGTFIEADTTQPLEVQKKAFPFLLGGTFIEAGENHTVNRPAEIFPSFWEGLSLRLRIMHLFGGTPSGFPFLLGGTFIEARGRKHKAAIGLGFSLPFGRDFH